MALSMAFRYRDREYYTELAENTVITFGSHKTDMIQISGSKDHLLMLKYMNGKLTAVMADMPERIIETNKIEVLNKEEKSLLYASRLIGTTASFVLPYQGRLTFGREDDNDIVLTFPLISRRHFQLLLENGQVHVEDLGSTHHIYLNGRRVEKALMTNGDILSIYTFRFVLKNGELFFENMGSSVHLPQKDYAEKVNGKQRRDKDILGGKYLEYHLSPRIREQLPQEAIILSAPPSPGPAGGGRQGNWAYLIGSGAMFAASLATGMINPAMLLMRAMSLISPIANMAAFKKMSKQEQEQLEEYERIRHESYQAYIADQKARIGKIADVQRRILNEENPVPSAWIGNTMSLHRSLWERKADDSDFLVTRLGEGKDKLCVEVKSRTDSDGFSMNDDELEKLSAQIIEETRYVEKMPVRVSLKDYQTIGVVGSYADSVYLIRSMLVEITAAHTFRDVRIVGLFDKNEKGRWGVLRWLPHICDETGQIHYIGFSERETHEVCDLISDMIRRRKRKTDGEYQQKKEAPLPHYIVIVQSRNLIRKESIYDDLISNDPSLGVTTIFLAESMYDLPQNCQFLIELGKTSLAYAREHYDDRRYFVQDDLVHTKQLDAYMRRLAAIELEDRYAEAAIPSSLTFLEGYGVKTVEDLDILNRWKTSSPHQTLAAPIGMMTGGRIFSLDIMSGDQAHGPHGLLAGTTGSGKSELLQSWILSMAVNYHPDDVNFVIIDYKGGGMSDLLEPLPHVVGKITNIDRNIGRSLVSLKSELKRRERLFAEAGVNNIGKYQRAWQAGAAKERLPHLIIVTDEFAELKKEEPEFMTELNSVATTGRSLGIHMLLATQKPAGVVNDQINSNSRFRICMKVQDVADSREMLKRPDAAKITQAGRAYIRVGEDELFELFQSFYSAASYTGKQNNDIQTENQVRIVNVNGNRINYAPKRKNKAHTGEDQLTAVIKHINHLCEIARITKMRGPWLPELERWIPLEKLDLNGGFNGEEWPSQRKGLSIPIGMFDIPSLQEQGVQMLNISAEGHFAVFGMPGTGKSFLLKTILVSLGRYYTPRDVQITVIDAGNWTMSEMSAMPHVDQVILNQDTEKLRQFRIRLRKTLEARKHAFLKAAVNSLEAYHESVSSDLPAIVVVIDQIGPLLDQDLDFADLMEQIAASGAAYGIHLIFSANSTSGIKYKFLQLIKGAITLQMPDKSDYSSIVGNISGISLPTVPGRALIRGNPPVAFQTAVYLDEKADTARTEKLKLLFEKMQIAWDNKKIKKELDLTVHDKVKYEKREILPVGKDTGTLEPVYVSLNGNNYTMIISSIDSSDNMKALCGAEELLRTKDENQIYRIGSDTNEETIQAIMETLSQTLNERLKNLKKDKEKTDFNEQNWSHKYTQICLLIDDLTEFVKRLNPDQEKSFGIIFSSAKGLGLLILAAVKKGDLDLQTENRVLYAAANARTLLCFGGRPVEHVCGGLKSVDDVLEMALLSEFEAGLYDENGLRIIECSWRK